MAPHSDARFSTYSGAPSLQPSLAPTFQTQASSYSHHRCDPSERERIIKVPSSPSKMANSSQYSSSNTKDADLTSWSGALERMQDERLDKQRYVMSHNKSDEVSKLALGAKVERALARRMVGQDASFSAKTKSRMNEKRGLEVRAT